MAATMTAEAIAEVLRDKGEEHEALARDRAALAQAQNEHAASSERRTRELDQRERALREREHQADLRAAREGVVEQRIANLSRREADVQERERRAEASDATLRRRAKGDYRRGGEPVLVLALLAEGDAERIVDMLPTAAWRWSRAVPTGGPVGLLDHARQALATASYHAVPGTEAQRGHWCRMTGSEAA